MRYVKFNNKPFDRSVNNLVDELFTGFPILFNEEKNSLSEHGIVPVNIKESTTAYSLEVIAPGFNKEDFKINLEADLLTISAERKTEKESQSDLKEKLIKKEYSFKSFKRSFTIDDKIDATAIEASYVNGVMVLNLPKKTEVREAAKEIVIK